MMNFKVGYHILIVTAALPLWAGLCSAAVAPDDKVTTLKPVKVIAKQKSDKDAAPLPDVEGARIYSGKKTSTVALNEAPPIVNNNLRQTFEKTPGLLVSEESTPLVSIGYRGLNPDRAQFMQVLKDGVPIVADIFGYPEAYYIPPTQVVDHIDFVRGGSALLYGTQPGGAINFVTKDPYADKPFSVLTENSFGSHDFFSNYTALSGTSGDFGYYGYAHRRQSQGFREFNSQYEVDYGGAKLDWNSGPGTRWTGTFDLYNEEHGEPGGLTRAAFDTNDSQSTRLMDRFRLERDAGSVGVEHEISDKLLLELKGFGAYYSRYSERQRGGGFGTIPTGAAANTNDIQLQEFYTAGADGRARLRYDGFGADENILTAGVFYYHSRSPRLDARGSEPDASEGTVRQDADRTMTDVSLFAENLFRWGKFSFTPGVRVENIWQDVKETTNVAKTTVPLSDESEHDIVPLFGAGAAYELAENVQVYGNLSQGYRPKLFNQFVPTGTNEIVNGDLKEGRSWQADVGLRGTPVPFLTADASWFYMEFADQIGTVGNSVQNVGDAEYFGAETAVELGMTGLWDALFGSQVEDAIGALGLFWNGTFLDAEFTGGPTTGKTPQYAPDYLMRAGAEYRLGDKAKIRLGGAFLDDHFGDDGNTANRRIPSYKVWDLTGEVALCDTMALFGGINNLFDEHYFARVTGAGIDPADGRNYYGGARFKW